MVNMKQLPFYFGEDDVFWKILEKTELLESDVRSALLAYAYTIRRDRDEVWEKLNEAYKAFRRLGLNLSRKDMEEMYHLR